MIVIDDVAVLTGVVVDTVSRGGEPSTFVMPLTQVWLAEGGSWRCVAGHAGPRIDRDG